MKLEFKFLKSCFPENCGTEELETDLKRVPYLNLTVRTWKWMVGIWSFPFGAKEPIFQVFLLLLSGRVIIWNQTCTGLWLQICFPFHPDLSWGRGSRFDWLIFFRRGLVQPPTSVCWGFPFGVFQWFLCLWGSETWPLDPSWNVGQRGQGKMMRAAWL